MQTMITRVSKGTGPANRSGRPATQAATKPGTPPMAAFAALPEKQFAAPVYASPKPVEQRRVAPAPGYVSPVPMVPRRTEPGVTHASTPPAVQRRGVNAFAVEAGRLGLAGGGGRPLPGPLRGHMESALGTDFSGVRVHVGPQAGRIGAVAAAMGNDLHFAPGRYQPETVAGRQLLGHELAHVVQQRAGRVPNRLGIGTAVVDDKGLEAEAERLGQRAAAHRGTERPAAAAAPAGPAVAIQRMNGDEGKMEDSEPEDKPRQAKKSKPKSKRNRFNILRWKKKPEAKAELPKSHELSGLARPTIHTFNRKQLKHQLKLIKALDEEVSKARLSESLYDLGTIEVPKNFNVYEAELEPSGKHIGQAFFRPDDEIEAGMPGVRSENVELKK